MGNISKARKNVGTQFGLLSVIICMVAGLAMKMRPLVILGRSVIAFTISAMLGHILISFIQAHSRYKKKPPAKRKAEADSVDNGANSQDKNTDIETAEV